MIDLASGEEALSSTIFLTIFLVSRIFLGEIPQYLAFEPRIPIGKTIVNGKAYIDSLLDDTAIVYKAKSGLFIITGCSHSGICNIIEHAKKVCSSDKILGVIGGFHMFDCDERLECFEGT